MNGSSFNSAALNGSSSQAKIEYLPAGTASIALALNERIAVSMVGNATFGATLLGDLSRVAQLGTGESVSAFSVTGELTQHRQVGLGEAVTGIALSPSGAVAAKVLGPPGMLTRGINATGTLTCLTSIEGVSGWGHGMTGSLWQQGSLTGQSSIAWTSVAVLSAQRALGEGTSLIQREAAGMLSQRGGLRGDSSVSRTHEGQLTLGQRISLPLAEAPFELHGDATLQSTTRLQGTAFLAVVPEGDLARGQHVLLSLAEADLGLEGTATLYSTPTLQGTAVQAWSPEGDLAVGLRIPLPLAEATFTHQGTATLQGTLRLNGTALKAVVPVGVLALGLRVSLPLAEGSFALEGGASLQGTLRMQGMSRRTNTLRGDLVRRRGMQGQALSQRNFTGTLSNNASGPDLATLLMTRPRTEREMTR